MNLRNELENFAAIKMMTVNGSISRELELFENELRKVIINTDHDLDVYDSCYETDHDLDVYDSSYEYAKI